MSRVILETADGEFVHAAEISGDLPELIIWNGRYFVADAFVPGADTNGLTYTEMVPVELPYEEDG